MWEKIKNGLYIITHPRATVFKSEKRFLKFKLISATIPTIYLVIVILCLCGLDKSNEFLHYLNYGDGDIIFFILMALSVIFTVVSNPSVIFKVGVVIGSFVTRILCWFPLIDILLGIAAGILFSLQILLMFPVVICVVGIVSSIKRIMEGSE